MDDPAPSQRHQTRRARRFAGIALAPFVILLVIAAMLYLRSSTEVVTDLPRPIASLPTTIPTEAGTGNAGFPSSQRPSLASTPLSAPDVTGDEVSAYQPAPPISAAFFYPWFPNLWTQSGISPFTMFRPTLGLYSSVDDTVIDAQLSLAARAHIKAFISSWWGPGDSTDIALQHLLRRTLRGDSPYPSLRWAIYYEKEGTGDPTVTQIVDDLDYLNRTAFADPAYLKIDGRPVVFVYADPSDGAGMADRWAKAKAQFDQSVYVVLKVYAGYATDPNQPDSWHQYSPAVPYDSQLPYSVTVSPGFWKAGETPLLARDPARFADNVHQMVSSGAFWQLVTTWNEWGEGTAVEPSAEFGDAYLDPLCKNWPGTFFCTGTTYGGSALTIARIATPASGLRSGSPVSSATPGGSAASRRTVRSTPAPAVSASSPLPTPAPTPPAIPGAVSAAPAGSAIVVAAGDISCGDDSPGASCRQMDTSNLALRINPDAVLVLGDNQYEKGQLDNYRGFFDQSWGRLRSKMHPAVGNHEYLTPGASGYFDYFNGVGVSTGQAGERGKGYYSFDVGAWHLIAINSNCGPVGGCGVGSPQEQWLRADLAAHPTACSLMYMHHPLWSSDKREFELVELEPLYQDFYDHGGDLVLTGHSHYYERFAPQDLTRNADPLHGIREIIVGTGGRNVYGFGPIRPNSEIRDGKSFGVVKLTLEPTSYQWQFVPIAGETFTDSGSQACH